jgi:hypothetical protein
MNLLHRLADPTIKLDDFDRYFLSLLRELNYNFGLQVYCKRSDIGRNPRTRWWMSVVCSMASQILSATMTEEKFEYYEFISPQYIQKERGRGV